MKRTPMMEVFVFTCLAAAAWGDSTATIGVTVSMEEVISVSLDTADWVIGPVALGEPSVLPTVTATNDGNVIIDLAISATDGAGGWTVGTAGANTFQVDVAAPVLVLSTSNQSLATNVALAGTVEIDLTFTAPSSDTFGGGVDQSFDIAVAASKSP